MKPPPNIEGPKDGDLGRRVWAGVILIPVYAGAMIVGREAFLGVILILTGIGVWEFVRMASLKGVRPRFLPGLGVAMAFPAVFYWSGDPLAITGVLLFGVIGISVTQLLDRNAVEPLTNVGVTLLGASYVGLLLGHQVLVREFSRSLPGAPYWTGAVLLVVPLVLTWINDSAAYFIGNRWGRHRLLPRISPGKSVEGAVGALVITILAAIPVVEIVGRTVHLFDSIDALLMGALVGVAAPCGDLIESSFKRDAGIKDTSGLIPGHGGILDRFDSLLVTVPAFFYYLVGVTL